MAFAPGANIVVSLPEFDKPASAKIIHENKSGTLRVQLENGERITVSPEDVFNTTADIADSLKSPKKKSRPRSKSGTRGRSPGRQRAKSPGRRKSPGRKTVTPRSPKVEASSSSVTSPRRKAAIKAEAQIKDSPIMSLRLRKWDGAVGTPTSALEDTVDSDGEGVVTRSAKKKGKDAVDAPAKKRETEFCGTFGVVTMLLLMIGVLLTCQLVIRSARQSVAGLKPNQTDVILPRVKASLDVRKIDLKALFTNFPKPDPLAAGVYFGFFVLQLLLSLLPLGPLEKAVPFTPGPDTYRCNGIFNALFTLAGVCVLHTYFKIGLTQKQLIDFLPQWTLLGAATGLLLGAVCAFKASKLPLAQQNPKLANTGAIYNFFMGKEIAPTLGILNIKAALIKHTCVSVLALHLALFFSLDASQRTPTLMFAYALINLYLADNLLFERYFYSTFEYATEGTGLMITAGYLIYPFYPLLITTYIATSRAQLNNYASIGIAVLYFLGYIVFRASNVEKAKFRKSPMDPMFANCEVITTTRGKRLLCSGWWKFVRHPNYLGDIIIHLCWGLISGFAHPIPWIWPICTIILLLHRSLRDNERCKAKYGDDWSRYCERVPYCILPKVY